jgi:ATP-binding cassette subfamily B protein
LNKTKRNSLSVLLHYAAGYRKLTLLGCILSGFSAVLSLLPFICVWFVVQAIFEALPNVANAQAAVHWGWLAVLFAVLSIAVYFAALMCTHLAAFRTATNMRKAGVDHLVELPLGFFSGNESGRLRKIIDDNADMTEGLLAHQLPDFMGAVVTPVAAIILLFVFDWRMGVLSLLLMAVALYLMMKMMGGDNANFFARYQASLEEMSSEAVEYVRGIPVVKVFQQTVHSFKGFYRAIMSYRQLATDYSMACRAPMTGFTTALNATFALLIPAGMLLTAAAMAGGNGWQVVLNFVFYILFTPACAGMMNRIMYASEALLQADEAVRKLDEVLLQKPLEQPTVTTVPQGADIVFDKVTFTYPGTDKQALQKVSFTVKTGQTVALVGPSGGGKTTAATLIPRFWDVDSGSVQVGGVDVRKMRSEELMRQVAFVFQDTKLFKQTLLENIRAARPTATREQVLQAAHAAQCDDIIAKLPQGLDTMVGAKGVYLSGGEQQRIALARAILKDAPIILLDEATAFADPENEHRIQLAFEELTRGKTVLMIAHRLSTVQNADQILVMKNGELTERGKHAKLIEEGGLYASMWHSYLQAANWKVGEEVRGA